MKPKFNVGDNVVYIPVLNYPYNDDAIYQIIDWNFLGPQNICYNLKNKGANTTVIDFNVAENRIRPLMHVKSKQEYLK